MARTELGGRLRGRSLLESLQRLIERTYDLETGVADVGKFVIGDEGYRTLYSPGAGGARTLMRSTSEGLSVSVYYPDALIACLERNDPTRRLDDDNVDAFATLVEELDHLLVIAERWRGGGVFSLLDLELHANVTKHLVLSHFVGRMRGHGRLGGADRAWIRGHLFEKADYAEPDPVLNERYRTAARLASRFIGALEEMEASARPTALRRFHRMTPREKSAHISALI